MEENVFQAVRELKNALMDDSRIKRLNDIEEKLYADEEVIKATTKKNDLENQYSHILSYKDKDSEEAKLIQKALYQAKLELDSLPLVKEYNSLFIEVRDLYMAIDDILFAPFRSKTLSSEAK